MNNVSTAGDNMNTTGVTETLGWLARVPEYIEGTHKIAHEIENALNVSWTGRRSELKILRINDIMFEGPPKNVETNLPRQRSSITETANHNSPLPGWTQQSFVASFELSFAVVTDQLAKAGSDLESRER